MGVEGNGHRRRLQPLELVRVGGIFGRKTGSHPDHVRGRLFPENAVTERGRPFDGVTIARSCLHRLGGLATAAAKPLFAVARLQRRIKAIDQSLPAEGFAQEAYCSGLHRPRPNALFLEGCHENDRRAATLRIQQALQFDAAHAGHLHVGD